MEPTEQERERCHLSAGDYTVTATWRLVCRDVESMVTRTFTATLEQ
jgi:hypothetical protein